MPRRTWWRLLSSNRQPADWGQPVSLSFTISNQGAVTPGHLTWAVYLSSDGLIDAGDALLQSVAFPTD